MGAGARQEPVEQTDETDIIRNLDVLEMMDMLEEDEVLLENYDDIEQLNEREDDGQSQQ